MNVSIHNGIHGDTAVKIASSIEAGIRSGRLVPGELLPTVRALAEHLHVSPTTVAGAYKRLQSRGMVLSEGRRGTRVCMRPPVRFRAPLPVPEGVRDLATGNPDPKLLPRVGRVLAQLDTEPELYGAPLNVTELVDLARDRFRADGIPAKGIAVVGGAMDGIERALREHMRPGDRVVLEDPSFPGFIDLVRGLGLAIEPVSVDGSGLEPGPLARALAEGAQAMLYCPAAQNPTGAALTEERVAELRRVLAEYPDTVLLEDDHAGPVSGVRPRTLIDESTKHWAVFRSVSKSLGPDLRTALVAGDDETVGGVEGKQLLGMRWVSHMLQRMVFGLWSDAKVQRDLAKAAKVYTARREALVAALAEYGIEAEAPSGLNLWIPVEEESATMSALLASGWMVDAGERYRLQSGPGLRVTFAGLEEKEAQRFAADLAEAMSPGSRRALA